MQGEVWKAPARNPAKRAVQDPGVEDGTVVVEVVKSRRIQIGRSAACLLNTSGQGTAERA